MLNASTCFCPVDICGNENWRNCCIESRRCCNRQGETRREIKLGADQTKGAKGRTVVLSTRVRREIGAQLRNQPRRYDDAPLIASQRNGRAFSNVSLSMLFKEICELASIRTSSHSGRRTFATRLNAKGGRNVDNSEAYGASDHFDDSVIL
jgi:integrase